MPLIPGKVFRTGNVSQMTSTGMCLGPRHVLKWE
jgi:hypothetical protein